MTPRAFQRQVERELGSLPEWVRKGLDNLAIVVEDRSPEGDLLGLFEGPNRLERSELDGPSRVVLYREAILEEGGDPARAIRETLAHEIGHWFGMTEEEIGVFEEEWAKR